MIGTTLAHYRITAALGAGGMGEVWRAQDTKLGREVALKVLPQEFAKDPNRMARFEREAKLLASLNHPNIATLYGLEAVSDADADADAGRTTFLVMELVEGEDLSERVRRGAIPVDEAIPIALQIAEALEAAHEAGIVHRDLKPANIKLTEDGAVKVLDFGLAKAWETEGGDVGSSLSPTLTQHATLEGVILGTAAYMSPEQARGKRVDKRADIWAFGVVLFEMLSGRRVFEGETVSDVLAAVLTREPDWEALPLGAPDGTVRLLHRCLERDPRRRLHDIADSRFDLEDRTPRSGGDAGPGRRVAAKRARAGALALLILGVAVGGIVAWRIRAPEDRRVIRFATVLPLAEELLQQWSVIAVSPDGTRIVFRHASEGRRGLFLRSLDGLEPTFIPGTEDGFGPIFSPDGRSLVFFYQPPGRLADSGLKRINLESGAVLDLATTGLTSIVGLTSAGHWAEDGSIVFSGTSPTIQKLASPGGTPSPVTALDEARGEQSHAQPRLLPGGTALLYVAMLASGREDVMVTSIGSATGKVLVEGATSPRYSPTGHLLFVRGSALFAASFDAGRLELTGEPFAVLEGLQVSVYGSYHHAHFDLSENGTLTYLVDSAFDRLGNIVWVDRQGVATPAFAEEGAYLAPRVSPDGTRIAYASIDLQSNQREIWVRDLERGTRTRLNFGRGLATDPIWSPDGRHIVFASNRDDGVINLYSMLATGDGEPVRLTQNVDRDRLMFPRIWLPDRSGIVFHQVKGSNDIGVWRPDSESEEMLVATPFSEFEPSVSPDGRFIAYVSEESGRREVYARALSGPTERVQISNEGADEPVWSPLGDELFYRRGVQMIAVRISTERGLVPGASSVLFEGSFEVDPFGNDVANYDVSRDGRRFLMVRRIVDPGRSRQQLNVIINWFEDVIRLDPGQ